MKLAFVLFKYFPYGGLQRDMLCSGMRKTWSDNGIVYGQTQNLYGLPDTAAEIIHQHVMARQG